MRSHFIRLFICIVVAGASLYSYIYKQNELTVLRLAIPSLAKELRSIQEENNRLKYEIDNFESPIHLTELMRMPEFGGLTFPYTNEVVSLPYPPPLPGKDLEDLIKEEQNESNTKAEKMQHALSNQQAKRINTSVNSRFA